MRDDDLAADRKTEAGAFSSRPRGEERLEQQRHDIFGNSRAAARDRDDDAPISQPSDTRIVPASSGKASAAFLIRLRNT